MKPPRSASSPGSASNQQEPDFSLVLGGPLFQLLRRAHLSDDALTLARRRIVVIALLAWLPLLVLSVLEGRALGGSVAVPFLHDIEVHIRYLVVLPLLIGAELVVHQRMRSVVAVFLERRLIPEHALPRFDAAVASAVRLRNSVLAEVLLIAFVYVVGILIVWRQYMALDASTWYATPSADGSTLSLAGIWFGYLSLPLFQFLLVRWYFRLFIWARFLWQVSRIELSLVPTHPDRLGGLGFLSKTVHAFTLLAVAHGAILAGPLANRIFYLGAGLLEFKVEIAVVLLLVLAVVIAPLLVFAPQLAQAKRDGLREYGTLSRALRARVRRQVAARRRARRRGVRRQRRHPVAGGSGEQLRGGADHAARTGDEGHDHPARGGNARADRAAGAHDDAAGRTVEEAAGYLVVDPTAEEGERDNPRPG